MSFLESLAVFLPAILTGFLIVQLLWDNGSPVALLLKVCIGTGVGLGVTSLLYFLYLLIFAGGEFFLYLQLAVLLFLLAIVLKRGNFRFAFPNLRPGLSAWQVAVACLVLPVIGLAVLGAVSVWTHRPFGTWDAFMIYDRTARFVYRGQSEWLQTFSPDIDPAFHADYPLLIPLNIAQAWQTLGRESQSVPRTLGGIFMLVCAGTLVSGLTLLKSIWQGLAGLLVLLNTPFFILSGPSQTADVPLTFFILSSVILIFLYTSTQRRGLLVLAGLSAGLAAWTKNEGDVFVIGILLGLLLAFVKNGPWRRLGYFAVGLATPLVIIIGFKVFLAPANDILGTNAAGLIRRIFEWPRHLAILGSYRTQILAIGGTAVSVILILGIYALVFGVEHNKQRNPAFIAALVAACVQAIGYYGIYLITPHPILWQLDFSLWRVLFHIYLPLLFVFFVFVTDIPKALGFQPRPIQSEGIA